MLGLLKYMSGLLSRSQIVYQGNILIIVGERCKPKQNKDTYRHKIKPEGHHLGGLQVAGCLDDRGVFYLYNRIKLGHYGAAVGTVGRPK